MTPSEAPPPRKRRLWPRALALVGLLLVAGLAAVVGFRQEIATRIARDWLESRGVAVASLEVNRLTPDLVEVRDITLGEEGEIALDLLLVEPDILNAQAPVRSVNVNGLRLRLDLRDGAPLLGSLQEAIDRLSAEASGEDENAGGFDPSQLPLVALNDVKVMLETPSGPMTADLNGSLSPSAGGDIAADLAAEIDSELGRIRARLEGGRTPDGFISLNAGVEDGRLAWQNFQIGTFSGRLSLSLPPGEAPRLDADFDLAELAYAPDAGPALQLSSGKLEARGDPAQAAMTLTLEGAEERLSLTATAQQDPSTEGLRSRLDLQGEVRTAGGLARFLPLPGPKITGGTLVFQAAGEGNLLSAATAPTTWQALPLPTPGKRLDLRGDAVLAEVSLADGTRGISAHLPLDLELADSGATFTLREDAEVRVEQPARAGLQALGLPADVLPLIASGLSLTLKSAGELPFRLVTAAAWPPREVAIAVTALAASDQGLRLSTQLDGEARLGDDLSLAAFTGRVDAEAAAPRIALDGREARNVRVALPLTLRHDSAGFAVALSRAGRLRIEQFGGGAPLRLQDPLDVTVSALTLESTAETAGYSYRLSAGEDGAGFAVTLAEAEPIPVEAGALGLRLDGSFDAARGHDAELEVRLAGLALPGYAVDVEAVEIEVALDRELRPASSRFALGPLVLGGAAPLAAPLRLDGKLQRQGAGYDIEAILALPGGRRPVQPLADIAVRYGDDGGARVEAVSRLLAFDPEGLQPADLSPLLADLEKVSGSLTAKAKAAWPLDPARESGRVTLSNFSFESAAGAVAGLDLDLVLTRLLPFASAPGQRLTIRSLDAAVPVEAIEIVFALDQEPRPQLAIAAGGFDLGGARWRIEPATLDPAAPRNDITLATEALDLATFFRLIEVDGLSGSGTLKGRLPVAFAGEDVIVEDGRFEALGPGKLQIRFEALRSALAGGGEYVEMAAQALEDFHFENLSITLAKTAANDATVRLSTLGANPAVLDGQPFQFNISLESNLTSVLAALKQGYSLSDDALKRAWRLRE